MEIFYKDSDLIIQDSDKKNIIFSPNSNNVAIEDLEVTHPGEYEKSGILLEVKQYNDILFYKFLIDSKHLAIVTSDCFEIKEEILSFFGDIDVLFIIGTKDAIKIFESIEAKVVIPYGESKDIFLNSMGQHTEETTKYKVKGDIGINNTEFVNLA